jgi:hypothetical protein
LLPLALAFIHLIRIFPILVDFVRGKLEKRGWRRRGRCSFLGLELLRGLADYSLDLLFLFLRLASSLLASSAPPVYPLAAALLVVSSILSSSGFRLQAEPCQPCLRLLGSVIVKA